MIFKTRLPAKNGQLPRGGLQFHLPQGSWNEQPPCGQAPTYHPVPVRLYGGGGACVQYELSDEGKSGTTCQTSDSLADQKKHMRGPHGLFPCPVPKCKEVQFRTVLEMQHHQQSMVLSLCPLFLRRPLMLRRSPK
ncbi:uncharacterized protein L3040_000774 [Drepanopeziza brunnea f. sp. 'multigermtubi']|uniref:uncharacterized protein n=1 Tax=Drepanopeziza brunnea f. sp. 'multigermtubi' TaxID=698441 RepID=UPI0023A0CE54|nr:hypothetical protein L3040_000774 [Drepanopeziza brunnea f. sp. 'multigermtubi']